MIKCSKTFRLFRYRLTRLKSSIHGNESICSIVLLKASLLSADGEIQIHVCKQTEVNSHNIT